MATLRSGFASDVPLQNSRAARHPLDPLDADEIRRVSAILTAEGRLRPGIKVIALTLHEPSREDLRRFEAGQALDRQVFCILLDTATGETEEAIASISGGRTVSARRLSGVQPPIVYGELRQAEQAARDDPDWQAAMRRRGVTDFSLCMVDLWPAGNFGTDRPGQRLSRALTWVRAHPGDNGYAHPVEGVITLIDLNAMKVVAVEDHRLAALPKEDGNYTADAVGPLRTDVKPLEIRQPEGPSFEVEGHEVRWQKWRFRIGFSYREGLILHQIRYVDGGRERPVLHRAALSDMVVPYGDPRPAYFHRNAFDAGEYGVGLSANSLRLGCDCLGEIRYFDAVVAGIAGEPEVIQNAICLHEEDAGILWKHTDWRLEHAEVRRSRRLVVSFIATLGNYEYGFYWQFYQDGSLELVVKMTGIISNGAVANGAAPPWGELVAPGLYGPIHQHFFSVRLDPAVDGPRNSVYEIDTVADPPGPENPHANAFRTHARLLGRESEAQRTVEPRAARFWRITNPSSLNRLGRPVSYRLMPGENVLPFAGPDASVSKRAAFMAKHLWVTRYDPRERYAAGDYPNQHAGGAGLPAYAAADRALESEELVLWYTIGAHHVVRMEDWPVMPAVALGFLLRPDGFFDRNPALDVPPSAHNGGGAPACH
jgi:primary-amine oxidase